MIKTIHILICIGFATLNLGCGSEVYRPQSVRIVNKSKQNAKNITLSSFDNKWIIPPFNLDSEKSTTIKLPQQIIPKDFLFKYEHGNGVNILDVHLNSFFDSGFTGKMLFVIDDWPLLTPKEDK